MDIAILIYTVTLTWMFLAYNVKQSFMKQILYMIVLINGALVVYVVGGVTSELEKLSQVYLKFSLYLFLIYLFVYFLQFVVDKIRVSQRKKREAVQYD